MSATVFDSAFKSAGITLSGGNLTATITSGTSNVGADHKISGLTYFECAIGISLTGSACVGLVNNAFNTATGTLLGVDANSVGYKNDGTVKINNLTIATIAAWVASNVIGCAINPQLGLVWFRVGAGGWNNDILANQDPANNIGGISLATLIISGLRPAFGGTTVIPNQSATATFTSGFANTPPTGYITVDTVAGNTASDEEGHTLATQSPSSFNTVESDPAEPIHTLPSSPFNIVIVGGIPTPTQSQRSVAYS